MRDIPKQCSKELLERAWASLKFCLARRKPWWEQLCRLDPGTSNQALAYLTKRNQVGICINPASNEAHEQSKPWQESLELGIFLFVVKF